MDESNSAGAALEQHRKFLIHLTFYYTYAQQNITKYSWQWHNWGAHSVYTTHDITTEPTQTPSTPGPGLRQTEVTSLVTTFRLLHCVIILWRERRTTENIAIKLQIFWHFFEILILWHFLSFLFCDWLYFTA